MNTKPNPTRRGQSTRTPQPVMQQLAAAVEQHFDELSQQAPIVEHLTIPGFLRQIDHRWHLDDIRRFGDKVGHMAESMQLAYLTTIDASLGVIRMFPRPLLRRVYDILSPQFGWPRLADVIAPPENAVRLKETLRAREKLAEKLREVAAETDQVEVLEAMTKVNDWIEGETQRLRGTMVAASPATPAE